MRAIAERLVIICAGGYGRETAAMVKDDARWELIGFADDDAALHGSEVAGVPVLGFPEDVVREAPDARVVVCQARASTDDRRKLVARLALPAERYASLSHAQASLAGSTSVGPGTVLLSGVVTTSSVQIGSHVAVMPGVVLVHDVTVEDYVTLAAGAKVGGNARVQEGAYIGMGALVRDGLTIGAGALVGMGSVVTRPVPPGEVWFGSPARARPAPG